MIYTQSLLRVGREVCTYIIIIIIIIITIIIISTLPKGRSLASKFYNRLCFQPFSSLLHTTPQPNHLSFPFWVFLSSSCLPVFPLVLISSNRPLSLYVRSSSSFFPKLSLLCFFPLL